GFRRHRRGRILRDLSARLPRGERKGRSPEKQGHRDPIGVAHVSGLLRPHRYSIKSGGMQGALMSPSPERHLNASSSARASSEFLQIVILRRQNDGRRGRLLLPIADEG